MEPAHTLIVPVILAGGEGTRLSPISTPDQPKPFVPLPDGSSLLTRTLTRVSDRRVFQPPIIIGHERHRFPLLNHARAAGVSPAAILLESAARNTALAVACAAGWALANPATRDAILAILPADHIVAPTESWTHAIVQAAKAAEATHNICLIGIQPTRPDPNFGYIALGAPLPASAVRQTTGFVEKPNDPEAYMDGHVWNSGQFIASARTIETLMKDHAPAIWEEAQILVAKMATDWEFIVLGGAMAEKNSPGNGPASTGSMAPATAFDRAVLEHIKPLCVEFAGEWQDLGTVAAWEQYTEKSVENYLVRPVRTDRPWGYYELLSFNPTRAEKRLHIFPGCRLSMQRHYHRSEAWQVVAGDAEVELNGQIHRLKAGDKIRIKEYEWHRLANSGIIELIIHEIQLGNPSELDIERAEDDYGRLDNAHLYCTNI